MKEPKYYYKGKILYQYCKENGLISNLIYPKIRKMQSANPDMPIEDVIEKVIENTINCDDCKTKYFYDGKALKKYCKENGLPYTTILTRIKTIKKENPTMSIEEVIENAINCDYCRTKYFYKGKTLYQYCLENGFQYSMIYYRIKNQQDEHPDMPIEEIIEKAINKGKDKDLYIKYCYNGMSLPKYCNENGLPINTIYKRMERIQNKNPNMKLDDVIEKALKLKTIEDVLNNNMNNFLDSNEINYSLNVDLAQEFLKDYMTSYFDSNNSFKSIGGNKVKRLVYEYKKNNNDQQ